MRVYRARVCSLLGGRGYIGEDKTVMCLRVDGGIDGCIEEGYMEQ